MVDQQIIDRIATWANVGGPSDCWEFRLKTFVRNYTGRLKYGRVSIGGKRFRAHRAAFELAFGKIPHGMYVCHRCDNTLCLNPSHLFAGTPQDNVADKMSKGRHAIAWGEKNGQSTLTDKQVREIRKRLKAGALQREIASEFGISQPLVSMIKNGRTRNAASNKSRRNKSP
jgi:hypothetical protein